jgi:hypothetical protein
MPAIAKEQHYSRSSEASEGERMQYAMQPACFLLRMRMQCPALADERSSAPDG